MKAKYIIGTIGILGYFAYIKLSKYLKESTISTDDFLRAENGNTFFLIIDIFENPKLKIPLLKWSVDKIKLIVDNQHIATSLPLTEQTNNFTQEFKVVPTADYESLTTGEKQTVVEITYKIIAGLKITHLYPIDTISSEEVPASNATNSTGSESNQQEQETCTCEIIK